MKKSVYILLILILLITLTNLIVIAITLRGYIKNDTGSYNVIDTSINRVQIDSIQVIIRHKDSIIYNIKEQVKYEQSKADSLNDNDAIDLFKELLSE